MSGPQFIALGDDGTICGPNGTPPDVSIATTSSGSQQIVVGMSAPASGQDWRLQMPTAGQALNLSTGQVGVGSGGSWLQGPLWCRLLAGATVLTVSAVVANRMAGMELLDPGGITLHQNVHSVYIPAGTPPQRITYGPNGGPTAGGAGLDGLRSFTVEAIVALIVNPGWTLKSWSNIQAGDQFSAFNLWLEVWTSQPLADPYGPMLL